jgi:hypothetical protein
LVGKPLPNKEFVYNVLFAAKDLPWENSAEATQEKTEWYSGHIHSTMKYG